MYNAAGSMTGSGEKIVTGNRSCQMVGTEADEEEAN